MLDINFIRTNIQKVKEACQKKNILVDVDKILDLDKKKRELLIQIERLKFEHNKITKEIKKRGKEVLEEKIEKAKTIKEKIRELEPLLGKIEKELQALLLTLPNIPFDDVPVGKDDSQNVVLRKVGKIPRFSFSFKDYLTLTQELDLIDIERASKIAGSRFGFIKGDLVLLQFALINWAIDLIRKKGFIPILPPVMLKEEMARGTGYFEAVDEKEAYFIPEDELYLVGTSEQSLIAMHANEVFEEKDLPKRYVGFSTCFRREAGSYGKDTRGILRVHQFDKVEMVIFCKPEDSEKEHKLLLSIEEEIMKKLKLPYQVVNICTGDLGRPAARKYDIEAWLPSENRYRETHSTSNCTDFQARRLNIRFKDKKGNLHFIHTLNGTGIALGRTMIMIIENYQQKEGYIKVPTVLQKYCGFKIIK